MLVAERIQVGGIIVSDLEGGARERSVALVDARGQRQNAVTDDAGAFAFSEVAPPYDLAVASASSGPMTVYLGLERDDPYVDLFERDGPSPAAESQTLRVSLHTHACGASPGWATVVTSSASGTGAATTSCSDGDGVLTVEVEHAWHGIAVDPSELIDVNVLVGNGACSSFAHARLDGIRSAPGETVDVGCVDPVVVPAMGPIMIGARGGPGDLPDWRWTTSLSLDLVGNPARPATALVLAAAPLAFTTAHLPLIPGAAIHVNVSASHPRGGHQGGFHRSTEAWSGARGVSAESIMLDVVPGPEIVRPAVGATLSRRGLGFEWHATGPTGEGRRRDPSGPSLATLAVSDRVRGTLRFRVITTTEEVSLSRLSMLGVPRLELGDHELDLSTMNGVAMDDVVSSDVATRRKHLDKTRPGAAAYLRVPFQVTN
jgi:hypothetical protein